MDILIYGAVVSTLLVIERDCRVGCICAAQILDVEGTLIAPILPEQHRDKHIRPPPREGIVDYHLTVRQVRSAHCNHVLAGHDLGTSRPTTRWEVSAIIAVDIRQPVAASGVLSQRRRIGVYAHLAPGSVIEGDLDAGIAWRDVLDVDSRIIPPHPPEEHRQVVGRPARSEAVVSSHFSPHMRPPDRHDVIRACAGDHRTACPTVPWEADPTRAVGVIDIPHPVAPGDRWTDRVRVCVRAGVVTLVVVELDCEAGV